NPQFAYATWARFQNNRGTTMFSRTTDGGQTWEPACEILDPGGTNANQGHQVVVLPDGALVNFFSHILYKNDAGGNSADNLHFDLSLALIRSSDRGTTWGTPIHVADMLPLGDTPTVPGYFGVPNPDGGTGVKAPVIFPDYAVDPASGNLYAVWEDARFGNF